MASHNQSELNFAKNDGIRVYAGSSSGSSKKCDNQGIRVYSVIADSYKADKSSTCLGENRPFYNYSYNFEELNKLASFINKNNVLRYKIVSHKKNVRKLSVSKNNNDIDLYCMEKIDPTDPKFEVDHIYEIQCMAYVVAAALHNIGNSEEALVILNQVSERLSKVLESNVNLNVTDQKTNKTKMNVFKVFIKMRWAQKDLAELLRNSNFDKDISHFFNKLKYAMQSIRNQLDTLMNDAESGLIRYAFKKIIEEFDIFNQSMKL